MAEKLIEIGVRCVIAAGWAVEDEPAEIFATRFYEALLAGARLIDAVGEAREAAWKANPDGRHLGRVPSARRSGLGWNRSQAVQRPPGRHAGRAEIASVFGLVLALENLVIEVRFGSRPARPRWTASAAWRPSTVRTGAARAAVAEAFGRRLRDGRGGSEQPCIEWLERAVGGRRRERQPAYRGAARNLRPAARGEI